jgi:hypothetical protein
MNFDIQAAIEIGKALAAAGATPSTQPQSVHCTDYDELLNKHVSVRTVTMIYTGTLVAVRKETLVLLEAAWIPETARFADFIATGKHNECEPYPEETPVFINRGALLDVCQIGGSNLPRSQK